MAIANTTRLNFFMRKFENDLKKRFICNIYAIFCSANWSKIYINWLLLFGFGFLFREIYNTLIFVNVQFIFNHTSVNNQQFYLISSKRCKLKVHKIDPIRN